MKRLALIAALLLPTAAFGQGAILQQGQVFQGHNTMWLGNGYVADAGGSLGNGLAPVNPTTGILPLGSASMNKGLGNCQFSAYASAAFYYQLCWGFDASGNAQIVYGGVGSAPTQGLNFVVNGVTYPFGTGIGNVVGPSPSATAGNAVVWNGALATKDAGAPPRVQVASFAALKALSLTPFSAGSTVGLVGYYAAGDMPQSTYKLSTSACSLNAGVGDTISQAASTTAGNCWLIVPQASLDPRQGGVITGGTDPNANNGTLLTTINTYAATVGNLPVKLGGATVGISSGGHIDVPGIEFGGGYVICISGQTCGSAGAGSYSAYTYWLNTGSQTVNVWLPPQPWGASTKPVGLINVLAESAAVPTLLTDMTVDCQNSVGCADITSQDGGVRLSKVTMLNPNTYGLWADVGFRMMMSNAKWGNNAALWTGYGVYLDCTVTSPGGTGDTIIDQFIDQGGYKGIYTSCGDVKIAASHLFPAPIGPSNWDAILYDYRQNGNKKATLTGPTIDNSSVRVLLSNGGDAPNFTFTAPVFEWNNGGTVDGLLVLQCGGSSPCGAASLGGPNILFSTILPNADSGNRLSVYTPIVLEDQFGNFNPSAWNQVAQMLWGTGFGCQYSCTNSPYQNMTAQGTQFTFTGNIVSGSKTINLASLLPPQGTAISDSASLNCLAANAKLTDLSYIAGILWFTGTTISPCNGTDTITVGGLTLHGTVNANNNYVTVTDLPSFALNEGFTSNDACGTHITGWITGYNDHTGDVITMNNSGSTPNCTQTGVTFTVTPYNYYIAPFDSGSQIFGSPTQATTTLNLRSDVPKGAFFWLSPRNGGASLLLNPLSGATLNSNSNAQTVLDGGFSVAPLFASGSSGQWFTPTNTFLSTAPPTSVTGGCTNIAFSPAIPASPLSFGVNVGTGCATNTFTVHFDSQSAALTRWQCSGQNTSSAALQVWTSASTTTTAQVQNLNSSRSPTNWTDSSIITLSCTPQ